MRASTTLHLAAEALESVFPKVSINLHRFVRHRIRELNWIADVSYDESLSLEELGDAMFWLGNYRHPDDNIRVLSRQKVCNIVAQMCNLGTTEIMVSRARLAGIWNKWLEVPSPYMPFSKSDLDMYFSNKELTREVKELGCA